MDSHTSATTSAAPAPAQQQGPPDAATPPAGRTAPASPAGGATATPPAGEGTTALAGANAGGATDTPASADAGEAQAAVEQPQAGFGSRGRLRRRARFLRKARELAYRDLGGLVFSLHRFGQRNDQLVLAKLATLSRIDAELRALEDTLEERRPVTVLREAGITACPRCAAIHSGEDRFCPGCGLSMSRRSDLPIAGAPAAGPQPAAAPQPPAPAQATAASAPPAQPPATAAAAPPPPGTAPTSPPNAAPATEQHAAAPASARAQPHAAPQPATQSFDAIPAGGAGRSPLPPRGAQPQEPATASDDDQPTEIIRPRAPGS